jgi:lipopolysaccharide/colanic/teichoic acid biosynthesis glycosyltransferase
LEPHEGLLGAPRWGHTLKRALDVVVAVLGLVALGPVFAVVATAIRLTSPGPVFYVQERVGQHGKQIRFRKFRTMRFDAHDLKDQLAEQNESDGPIFKIRNDPRITPIGRILRKLSIDELPQLLHVLTGDMTLVGPRPPLPEEVETYNAWQLQRLWVKPGITCIWQVSGRSDLDFETWVRMDVEYIRRWTPWLDLELLIRTIPAVLTGKGAY